MKKSILIILILIIVGLGIYWIVGGGNSLPNDDSTAAVSEVVEVSPDEKTDVTITFTDDGYSPQNVTVSIGDVVEWVNESSTDMWPASSLHPTHDVYPSGNGCIGSTFDSCGGIAPGESWRFKFTEKGSWGFHDHLAPIYTGSVIVE